MIRASWRALIRSDRDRPEPSYSEPVDSPCSAIACAWAVRAALHVLPSFRAMATWRWNDSAISLSLLSSIRATVVPTVSPSTLVIDRCEEVEFW